MISTANRHKASGPRPKAQSAELLDASSARAELSGWQGRVVDRSLERATRRSIERAQSLISAAIELLGEGDSDGFTVQEVADRAHQSLRTFYQHFGSKNDLLLAVFEEEVRRHAADLAEAVTRYTDPLDRLVAFVVTSFSPRAARSEQVALAQYRIELSITRPDDIALVQEPMVQLARRLVEEAMDAGAIPRRDPDGAVYMMMSLKSTLFHSRILGNQLGVELPDPQELARFCIEGLGGTYPEAFPRVV